MLSDIRIFGDFTHLIFSEELGLGVAHKRSIIEAYQNWYIRKFVIETLKSHVFRKVKSPKSCSQIINRISLGLLQNGAFHQAIFKNQTLVAYFHFSFLILLIRNVAPPTLETVLPHDLSWNFSSISQLKSHCYLQSYLLITCEATAIASICHTTHHFLHIIIFAHTTHITLAVVTSIWLLRTMAGFYQNSVRSSLRLLDSLNCYPSYEDQLKVSSIPLPNRKIQNCDF